MRKFGIGVLAGVPAILLAYAFLSVLVDGYFGGNMWPNGIERDSWSPPNNWATWRDIAIIGFAGFWAISGVIMMVLLGVLVWVALQIRKLLADNVAPAVDSLRESLDNVRGTTEFAGETIVSPLIRTYALVRGVRNGVAALSGFPNRVKGRKRKGKR